MSINYRNAVEAPSKRARAIISREIDRCKRLRYRFLRRYNRLSEMRLPEALRFTEKKGKKYYSEMWSENGQKKSRYLGKNENETVQLVQEKHFYELALKQLDEHIDVLEAFQKNELIFDPSAANDELPRAYRLSDESLEKAMGPDEEEKWYSEAKKKRAESYKKASDYYKAAHKHYAKDGTPMRSKSEVNIANALIDWGIKYVYEMPLRVMGLPFEPDFSFYSHSRGKVMLWEHAGMLGDEEYRRDFAERLSIYIKAGYVPCVDLILTFDTTDGNLDTRLIDAVIEEYL